MRVIIGSSCSGVCHVVTSDGVLLQCLVSLRFAQLSDDQWVGRTNHTQWDKVVHEKLVPGTKFLCFYLYTFPFFVRFEIQIAQKELIVFSNYVLRIFLWTSNSEEEKEEEEEEEEEEERKAFLCFRYFFTVHTVTITNEKNSNAVLTMNPQMVFTRESSFKRTN